MNKDATLERVKKIRFFKEKCDMHVLNKFRVYNSLRISSTATFSGRFRNWLKLLKCVQ